MNDLLRMHREIAGINPDIIFTVFGYPIANSTLMLVGIIIIICIASFILHFTFKKIPTGFQNVAEYTYESISKILTQITGNNQQSEKIFPLIGTLFVFIFMSNFIGLIPGVESITYKGINIFRTPTSDFNTTFALAFAMVIFLQLVAIKDWGILGYIGKFLQVHDVIKGFKQGIGSGLNAVINFFIGLLDIVGEIAKVISLSLRLFGNMYAGSVLATIILGGFAYGIPALWMSMSLLSAVVQTLVFSFLVTAYFTLSLKPKEEPVMNQP